MEGRQVLTTDTGCLSEKRRVSRLPIWGVKHIHDDDTHETGVGEARTRTRCVDGGAHQGINSPRGSRIRFGYSLSKSTRQAASLASSVMPAWAGLVEGSRMRSMCRRTAGSVGKTRRWYSRSAVPPLTAMQRMRG